MKLLDGLIAASVEAGGAAANNPAVRYTQQSVTAAQQAQARTNIAAEERTKHISVSGTAPTVSPEHNTVYHYGVLDSLTITNVPTVGDWAIVFVSGTAATVLTVPQSLVFPASFQVEPNMRYEINVSDGYGLAVGWAVSASE